ncbi:MAG: hypothetical protein V3U72_01715 [Candidatus Aenigmarchaeota archaeon]
MIGEEGPEGKWKEIIDKLSAIEDLQNLTQLDIINLKNEIDKIKLTSPSPMPPEVEERMVELEEIAKNVDILKKWKQTVEEVKFLRSKITGYPTPQAEPIEGKGLEDIRNEIEQIREEIGANKFPSAPAPIDVSDLRNAIEENRKTIDSLKSMISERPEGFPGSDFITKMIKDNRKLIGEMRSKARAPVSEIPAEVHGELEALHNELTKLEEEVKRVREEKPEEGAKDEIGSLKNELFTKLEELNVKFGTEKSEELKNVVEANKASIERLKSLVSGEEAGIEEIKMEIEGNRKFMGDLKRMLLAKKPKEKIVLPPDPELKKKMFRVEQRVEFLGRRLEKMDEMRPAEVPELPVPAPMKITKGSDLEKMKNDVDSILSRMGGFVTKDDMKRELPRKEIKAGGKPISKDLSEELDDIKRTIVRNEDHIDHIVSDMEGMKKEVGMVEKHELDEISEIPAIEDIEKRIEEIERKLKTSHSGLILIE